MSCDDARKNLVAYHFGLLRGDSRSDLEAHLPTCQTCVRELVETKRAIELGEHGPTPSPRARARLRSAVATEVAFVPAWWETPFAFVAAAALLVVAGIATLGLTARPGVPPYGAHASAMAVPVARSVRISSSVSTQSPRKASGYELGRGPWRKSAILEQCSLSRRSAANSRPSLPWHSPEPPPLPP